MSVFQKAVPRHGIIGEFPDSPPTTLQARSRETDPLAQEVRALFHWQSQVAANLFEQRAFAF